MQVVAYLRVSTDKQAEEGMGLAVQAEAIERWARRHRHHLVATFRDEGISGSNGLDTRIGLADAIRALREGAAEGLVVYRLDRLARDLVLQESLIGEIGRMGKRLFTTTAAEAGYIDNDDADPSRKMIRQILGAVNEYERSMIALRLRSGRAAKAAHGGFAYGSPAIGYKAEGGELVPVDDEQATVARIRLLRDEGKSLRTIVDTLDREGRRTKRGARWHPATVARVLEREREISPAA